MARVVTAIMQSQGGGAIINVSTFSAFPTEPFVSGVQRAARRIGGLRQDVFGLVRADGIRMNNVLPRFMDSYPESDEAIARIPAGRYGRVEELAATVAFFLSPDATYIIGQNIRVDGGLSRSV